MSVLALAAIILIWTVGRETLLDRFAYASHPNSLRNSAFIVAGCFLSTMVLMILFM